MVRRPHLGVEYILVRIAFAGAVCAALTAFFSFPFGFFPVDFFLGPLLPLMGAVFLVGFRRNLWWRDLLVSCLVPIPMGVGLGWWILLTASAVGFDGWGAEECALLAALAAWKPFLLGLVFGTAPLALAAHLFRKGFSSEIRAIVLLAGLTASLATTVAVAFPPIVTSRHRAELEPGATRRWAWYIPRRCDDEQDGTGDLQIAKDRTFVRFSAGGIAALALAICAVAVVRGRRRAASSETVRAVEGAGSAPTSVGGALRIGGADGGEEAFVEHSVPSPASRTDASSGPLETGEATGGEAVKFERK